MDGVVDVSAAEFLVELEKAVGAADVVVLDIRTADEFELYHLRGAVNVDFYGDDFARRLAELSRDKLYLLYCRTGRRSGTAEGNARDLMREMGFERVLNLLGGIHAFMRLERADDFVVE